MKEDDYHAYMRGSEPLRRGQHPYKCKHCCKVVWRESKKKWIKSYCSTTGRTVHLMRAK